MNTDSDRIDWLQRTKSLLSYVELADRWKESIDDKYHLCVEINGQSVRFYGKTYREVIDTAMKLLRL